MNSYRGRCFGIMGTYAQTGIRRTGDGDEFGFSSAQFTPSQILPPKKKELDLTFRASDYDDSLPHILLELRQIGRRSRCVFSQNSR